MIDIYIKAKKLVVWLMGRFGKGLKQAPVGSVTRVGKLTRGFYLSIW